MPTFFICEHINIQGLERSVKKNIRGMFFSGDRRILRNINYEFALIVSQNSRAKSLLVHQIKEVGFMPTFFICINIKTQGLEPSDFK